MYHTLELNFEPPRDFRASLLSAGFLGKDKKLKTLDAARFWVFFEPLSSFSVWETFKDMNRFVNESTAFFGGLGGNFLDVDMGELVTERQLDPQESDNHSFVRLIHHEVTLPTFSSSTFQQALESWSAQNPDHRYQWTAGIDHDPHRWMFSGIQTTAIVPDGGEATQSRRVLALSSLHGQ